MKILLTIGDLSIMGGAEHVVVNLANGFAKLGHEVQIFSCFRAKEEINFALLPNVNVHFKHKMGEKELKEKAYKNIFKKFFFKNIYKVYLSFYIKNTFNVDVLIASCNNYFPFFKNKNTKYIRIEHSCFVFTYKKYLEKKYLQKSRIKPRSSAFDRLVILSDREKELFARINKSISVIPNFMPAFPTESAKLESRVVLSVGRLTLAKNFVRLVEIWGILHDRHGANNILEGWELHIVGEGEDRKLIEDAIAKLQERARNSVKLLPFTKNIHRHYLEASIFALSSIYEGFPMVLVEASSFGLPCIGFDIPSGVSDIIESGKTGFIVEDGKLETYVQNLYKLISDEDLRKSFGKNAREKAQGNFSQSSIMQIWEDLISEGSKEGRSEAGGF